MSNKITDNTFYLKHASSSGDLALSKYALTYSNPGKPTWFTATMSWLHVLISCITIVFILHMKQTMN